MLKFGHFIKDVEYKGSTYEMYEDPKCPTATCDICDFWDFCSREISKERAPHLEFCEKVSDGNNHIFFCKKK